MRRHWWSRDRCPACGQVATLHTPKSDPQATPMCLQCGVMAMWNSPEEEMRRRPIIDKLVADVAEPVRIEGLAWEASRFLDAQVGES